MVKTAKIFIASRLDNFYSTVCPECGHTWRLKNQELDGTGSLTCPTCKNTWTPTAGEIKKLVPTDDPAKEKPAKDASALMMASGDSMLDFGLQAAQAASAKRLESLTSHAAAAKALDLSAQAASFNSGFLAAQTAPRPAPAVASTKNYVTLGQKVLVANPSAKTMAAPVPRRFESRIDFQKRQWDFEESFKAKSLQADDAGIDRETHPLEFSDSWRKACGTYVPAQTAFSSAMNQAHKANVQAASGKSVHIILDASALAEQRRKLASNGQPSWLAGNP